MPVDNALPPFELIPQLCKSLSPLASSRTLEEMHRELGKSKEISLLRSLYSGPRFAQYQRYIQNQLENAYFDRLLEAFDCCSLELRQIEQLYHKSPERKERLIQRLFLFYSEPEPFIGAKDQTTQVMAERFMSIFLRLRSIDSTGFFLQLFSLPFKRLFTERADCVPVMLRTMVQHFSFHEKEPGPAEWLPDSAEAEYVKIGDSFRSGDAFQVFVDLFGGKTEFAKKYEAYLFSATMGAMEEIPSLRKELLRQFSLLSQRLGEMSLQRPRVMLHDLELCNSSRLLVLSHEYWPLDGDQWSLRCPDALTRFLPKSLQSGNKVFALDLRFGCLSLQLEWEDGEKAKVRCTPLYFCVLQVIGGQRWTWEALLKATGAPSEDALIECLRFWLREGAVSINQQKLIFQGDNHTPISLDHREVAVALALDSLKDEPADEWAPERAYLPYIRSVLGNVGAMTASRLHSLLRRFVPATTKYVTTEERLLKYLQHLSSTGDLAYDQQSQNYAIGRSDPP